MVISKIMGTSICPKDCWLGTYQTGYVES